MSDAQRTLCLGTRGSRLAMAQSRQVAAAIEQLHPGICVRLTTITTRGDRDLRTPLSQVRDGDFFAAEIDAALLQGEVDFTVHSRKDLAETRPAGLVNAAMPRRANPRDVVLFRPSVIERLQRGCTLRIGTSSQRRAHNVAEFLARALPRVGPAPRLETHPVRGPVDQRLDLLDDEHDQALDGIVLALAGLQRLWDDPDGRRLIAAKLAGLRWMVLPLSECPAAPGQGALAIECRREDTATQQLLRTLHDTRTAHEVSAEYAAVGILDKAEQPTFGATAVHVPHLGQLVFVRGPAQQANLPDWPAPPQPSGSRAWDGSEWHRACKFRALPWHVPSATGAAMFVAHSRALESTHEVDHALRLWVSGWQSWQRLSAAGWWVEGCADGLGFAAVRSTLEAGVLQLPSLENWLVLTRAGAEDSWQQTRVGQVIATYALEPPDAATLARLRQGAGHATDFFWSSRDQYLAMRDSLPPAARHACGAGKTFHALTELDAQPRAFPSREAWQAWVG